MKKVELESVAAGEHMPLSQGEGGGPARSGAFLRTLTAVAATVRFPIWGLGGEEIEWFGNNRLGYLFICVFLFCVIDTFKIFGIKFVQHSHQERVWMRYGYSKSVFYASCSVFASCATVGTSLGWFYCTCYSG